jgi:hypothetical protein
VHERASLPRGLNLVATELCDADNYWNIVSADLKNEPFAMFWGAPRSRAPRHHSTKQRTSGMRWLPSWGLTTGVVPAGPSSCRALARALACAGRSMTQPRRARLGHTTTLCDTPSAPGQQDMSTPTRQAFGRVRTYGARPHLRYKLVSGARTSAIIGEVVYRPAYLYAKRPHGLRRKSNSPRPAFLDDTQHAWDLGPNMGLSSILRRPKRGMGLAVGGIPGIATPSPTARNW